MTFEVAIEFILEAEGGYVNDPADRGGETNYGISQLAFNIALEQGIIDDSIAVLLI